MEYNWTLIIIGLYTLINIYVFTIQKTQIEKQKEIISLMNNFNKLFDFKKVKEFAELKDETNLMKIDKIISDDKKVTEIMQRVTNKSLDKLVKIYIQQMGNQHFEMTSVIVQVLKSIDKEEREPFITEYLESCKHIFIPMLDDIETNKL